MDTKKKVGSVDRALVLLNVINRSGRLSVQQAANLLSIDRSSAYRLLETLTANGYACKMEDSIYYEPGFEMDAYMIDRPSADEIYAASQSRMARLQIETGMSSHMCVLTGGMMRFLGQEFGNDIVRITMNGDEPLHCTASGKTVLAYLPLSYREHLLENMRYRAFTPHTITEREELMRELDRVRAQGYALDQCELYEGVYCIAAPVFARKGWPLYSLGISSTRPLNGAQIDYAAIVVRVARELSESLQRKVRFGFGGEMIEPDTAVE